ncbi:PH domain-containing protein [Mesoplasma syrphidae]|nr:PH domain-containing protein [Mesoplasma syrphidae]
MKNIDQIKKELISNHCSNFELIEKREFTRALNMIFDLEKMLYLIVGSIDNEPWLLLLTDQRIIMIQKETEMGSFIQQYGLEEVNDLKLDSFGKIAALTFIFENKSLIKVDYLSLKQANEFGRLLVEAIENWTNKLDQFLV